MKQIDFTDLAKREIFLNPGELGCGAEREVFGTLLGSCVAITLWHPGRRLGCICHFILPNGGTQRGAVGRYGDSAFALMQRELVRHGVRLSDCVAKIFGGGRMFGGADSGQDVGDRNVATARQLLLQAGLPVAAEHVGGDGYRRLYFDVASGEIWLKFDWVDTDQEDLLL